MAVPRNIWGTDKNETEVKKLGFILLLGMFQRFQNYFVLLLEKTVVEFYSLKFYGKNMTKVTSGTFLKN